MFKLAKWSFDRGVQHERMRIKKLIAEYHAMPDYDRVMLGMINDDQSEHDKEVERAGTQRAAEILDRLIRPDHDQIIMGKAPIDKE